MPKKEEKQEVVDIISLVRHLREEFPIPYNWGIILEEMAKFLEVKEDEVDQTTQVDAYRCLIRKWGREGWVWDNNVGAVLPEENEDVSFDNECITLASGKGMSTMVITLSHGDHHDRVVWF